MRFTVAIISSAAIAVVGLATIDLAVAVPTATHFDTLAKRSGGFAEPVQWTTLFDGSQNGEPLNVVVSNRSDTQILRDPKDWLASLGFVPANCPEFSDAETSYASLNPNDGDFPGKLYREKDSTNPTTCNEQSNGGLRLWVFRAPAFHGQALFMAATRDDKLPDPDHGPFQLPTPNGYSEGRAGIAAKTITKGGTVSPVTQTRFTYSDFDEIEPFYEYSKIEPENVGKPVQFDGIAILFTVFGD